MAKSDKVTEKYVKRLLADENATTLKEANDIQAEKMKKEQDLEIRNRLIKSLFVYICIFFCIFLIYYFNPYLLIKKYFFN